MPTAWTALADPHRRTLVELLRERPRPVGELVTLVGLSQPGTSKHLRVLRDAGLVRVRAEAQRRVYELDTRPLVELDAWLAPYRRMWEERLDALGDHLDRKAGRPTASARPTGAARPSATSRATHPTTKE